MQGVWYDDSGLRNITGISNKIITKLAQEEHIEYLSQIMEFNKKGRWEQFLNREEFGLDVLFYFVIDIHLLGGIDLNNDR